jgi:hypothetical protein
VCPLSFEFKRRQIGWQRPLTRPGTFNDKRLLLSIQDDSVILMRLFLCSYNKHNKRENWRNGEGAARVFCFPTLWYLCYTRCKTLQQIGWRVAITTADYRSDENSGLRRSCNSMLMMQTISKNEATFRLWFNTYCFDIVIRRCSDLFWVLFTSHTWKDPPTIYRWKSSTVSSDIQ